MLLAVLIAAPVGIGVAETDDARVASAIADALERTIDRDFLRGAVRIPSDVESARREMGVGDVVLLRVFAGVTQHLVIADGFLASGEKRQVKLSLPATGRGWDVELTTAARELVPPEPALPPPIPIAETTTTIGLWGPALIIASAVLVGTAAILFERAADARMDLLASEGDPLEFDRLAQKRDDYRLSSIVMFGLGGLFAAGGVALVVFDL